MFKDFLLVRHRPHVPKADLQHYLQYKHAPLALSLPLIAQAMLRYTMNQVEESLTEEVCLYPRMLDLTTIVEHKLGPGVEHIGTDAEYLATVRPDEQYMMAELMDGAPQCVAVDIELPIFKSASPSNLRMFDLIRHPIGMPRAEFLDRLAEDGQWATQHAGYRAAVAARVHCIVGSGSDEGDRSQASVVDFGATDEPFDAVVETWVADLSTLTGLMEEQRARRAAFCDARRSFTAVTQEHWMRGVADAFGPRSQQAVPAEPVAS